MRLSTQSKINNTSKVEIATIADMSVSYVTRVLNGQRIPRVHYFKRIADALGVSMDNLYDHLKEYYN